ncbi:MAG: hypothetical protein MJZ64_04740 [Paludibacteraceae bacterium]|nr:hypothetical protein [Paludibacteraceae bacterium]
MNIVLDSNVILQVAFTQKPLKIVWDKLLEGAYSLCVTEDSHFDALKEIDFPKVDVINLMEFVSLLQKQYTINPNY